MRVSSQQSDLFQGMETVLDVVPSKAALPILSNLLLEASADGLLTLSATDLDLSISTRVPVEVQRPGGVTVPARKFAEIVRELPKVQLSIEATDSRVSIAAERLIGGSEDGPSDFEAAGRGVYSLSGIPAEDFPAMPSVLEGMVIRFGEAGGPDGAVMKDLVGKTAFAVSHDETRPVLCGVLWQVFSGQMRMVATDGHRLVRASRDIGGQGSAVSAQPNGSGVGDQGVEAIVPPKALTHLVKLLSASCDLKAVTIGENHVIFDLGSTVLSSRLIEGPYVDYEQVIRKESRYHLTVAHRLLAPAVRRVSILSSTHTHQIRMAIRARGVELSAASQEIGGEATESIVVDYAGEDFDVGYNAAYLLDILRRIDSENIVLDLDTPVSAGIIRPAEQREGEDYLCLLMPLRLNE